MIRTTHRLAYINDQGRQMAELILSANLDPGQRAKLIKIRQMVEAHLESRDPMIELALIEAAIPRELAITPQKSQFIIDLILSKDPWA
jgi:arginyl-tRNA synthetase